MSAVYRGEGNEATDNGEHCLPANRHSGPHGGGPVKIAILGLGYVGITAAACLAGEGHEVIGIDPNMTKVHAVRAGRSPITEPGVGDMIAEAHAQGLITASPTLTPDVAECELVIVCVGTPSAVDGS